MNTLNKGICGGGAVNKYQNHHSASIMQTPSIYMYCNDIAGIYNDTVLLHENVRYCGWLLPKYIMYKKYVLLKPMQWSKERNIWVLAQGISCEITTIFFLNGKRHSFLLNCLSAVLHQVLFLYWIPLYCRGIALWGKWYRWKQCIILKEAKGHNYWTTPIISCRKEEACLTCK